MTSCERCRCVYVDGTSVVECKHRLDIHGAAALLCHLHSTRPLHAGSVTFDFSVCLPVVGAEHVEQQLKQVFENQT